MSPAIEGTESPMSDPYAAYKIATIECAVCDWPFDIPVTGMDQTVTCPDCGAILAVTYDASFDHGRWQGRHYVRQGGTMSKPTTKQLACILAAADGRLSHRISQAGTSDVYEEPPKWGNDTRDPRYGTWTPVTLATFKACLLSQWIVRGVQREDRWFRYHATDAGRQVAGEREPT